MAELLAKARDQLRNCDGDEKEQPAHDDEAPLAPRETSELNSRLEPDPDACGTRPEEATPEGDREGGSHRRGDERPRCGNEENGDAHPQHIDPRGPRHVRTRGPARYGLTLRRHRHLHTRDGSLRP